MYVSLAYFVWAALVGCVLQALPGSATFTVSPSPLVFAMPFQVTQGGVNPVSNIFISASSVCSSTVSGGETTAIAATGSVVFTLNVALTDPTTYYICDQSSLSALQTLTFTRMTFSPKYLVSGVSTIDRIRQMTVEDICLSNHGLNEDSCGST